jgi:hypothetical protein
VKKRVLIDKNTNRGEERKMSLRGGFFLVFGV